MVKARNKVCTDLGVGTVEYVDKQAGYVKVWLDEMGYSVTLDIYAVRALHDFKDDDDIIRNAHDVEFL